MAAMWRLGPAASSEDRENSGAAALSFVAAAWKTRRRVVRKESPMTIAAILERKGGEVVTIEADAPLRDAVALLAERRIGALVVLEGGGVAGIVSERDVVYCLAREGAGVLERPVRRVMTAPAVTVEPRVAVLAALSDMSKRRIRHLPVVEGGRL